MGNLKKTIRKKGVVWTYKGLGGARRSPLPGQAPHSLEPKRGKSGPPLPPPGAGSGLMRFDEAISPQTKAGPRLRPRHFSGSPFPCLFASPPPHAAVRARRASDSGAGVSPRVISRPGGRSCPGQSTGNRPCRPAGRPPRSPGSWWYPRWTG